MNNKLIQIIQEVHEQFKARGNWGHEGRPGKRGGSLSKSGGAVLQEPVEDKSLGINKRMGKYYTDLLKMPKQDLEHLAMSKLGISDSYDEEGIKNLSRQIGNSKPKLAGALLAAKYGNNAAADVTRQHRTR